MAQMPKFLEDYTTVDELISKMNKEYPECRLIAEIIGYGDDWVIFKSSFYETKEDTEPKAVAYAKQTSKDHNSWFEMANTKANGRCLRIVFSESTLAEEMIGIAPSKDAAPKDKAPKKKSLDAKVKELEAEGLVEDITDSKQAIMNNIKEFAMEITNQDLDKARAFTAQALGILNMSKNDVSFGNMQSVKNKIQDIATEARTHVDKGE
tara:strand:+ start:1512 stop:2135 length:624 start_codon:yes stop_codon:yes gene_type:complete